jgi:phosphoglycerate dehydrogenase-like enzyme
MVNVAVAPEGTRDFLRAAVQEGGGALVSVEQAEALVWTAPADAQGLRALLRQHPNIRWVQLPWAGIEPYLEVLDDDHLWSGGQGVYSVPVAEHALALMLAGFRDLKKRSSARTWQRPSGRTLVEAKVTLFGAGGIAQELIKLLAPFRCAITVVRAKQEPVAGAKKVVTFERRIEAVATADVVVLALALTAKTRHCIGTAELSAMRPHAWLVNVARGGHVDMSALVEALEDRQIGGAALDVTDPEPLPDGHPLWSEPHCLITPHVGNTPEMAVPLLSERVRENVRRFVAGQPLLGVIDVEAGY